MPGVETFIAGIAANLGATAATAATIGTVTTRLLASVALSALSAALAPDIQEPDPPGIKTDFTQTGGTNFASFIVGRSATGGTHVCPPMTHGTVGDTPNAYLTYVIELSDLPGCTLEQIFVDGRAVGMAGSTGTYGRNASDGRFNNRLWWKYYDGTQTVADPMLLDKYGSYPERPWLSDMVGQGICYVILTFRYDRNIYKSFPQVRFEMKGVPLYDPRKDSTVGGTGAHRWDDPSTWEQSENFAVQAYNIHRGIDLGGPVWGGDMTADALPFDNWIAQMNVCDADIDGRPQYRTGMEITVDRTPADVSEELARGAAAEFAEVGGVFKLRCGAPALPVFFLTDDDLILDQDSRLQMIPDKRFRAVSATFPDPATLWEPREAPLRTDGGAVLPSDIAALDLPVPYSDQVQQLQLAYLEDQKRRRVLSAPLPPDASLLEPLDVVSYSSEVHGFVDKEFEVRSLSVDRATGVTIVSLREKDAADYDWDPGFALPDQAPSGAPVDPDAVTLPGFEATGGVIADAATGARKLAALLSWAEDLTAIQSVAWEIRIAGGEVVARGSDAAPDASQLIVTEGLFVGAAFEARAMPVMDVATQWTDWQTFFVAGDFVPGVPVITEQTYETSRGVRARVLMEWAAAPTVQAAVQYEVAAQGPRDVDWVPLGQTRDPAFVLSDIEPGDWRFRVRTLAPDGVASVWRERAQSIYGLSAPPAALQDAQLQTAGGLAILKWRLPSDVDVRIDGHVIVRHCASVPPSWADSVEMDEVAGGQALAVVPLKPGAYYLAARDSSGIVGPPVMLSTTGVQAVAFASIDQLQADPVYSGTLDGLVVNSGTLRLDSATAIEDWGTLGDLGRIGYIGGIVATGTYTFAAGLDFGSVSRVRLRSHVVMQLLDVQDTIGERGPVGEWPKVGSEVDAVGNVRVEIRTTDDDPAGAPVWSEWSRLESSEIEARGIQARAVLSVQNPNYQVRVSELRIDADEVTA